jgi:hypothetical protein
VEEVRAKQYEGIARSGGVVGRLTFRVGWSYL